MYDTTISSPWFSDTISQFSSYVFLVGKDCGMQMTKERLKNCALSIVDTEISSNLLL